MNNKTLQDAINRINKLDDEITQGKTLLSDALNTIDINTTPIEKISEMSKKINTKIKTKVTLINGNEFNKSVKALTGFNNTNEIKTEKVKNIENMKNTSNIFCNISTTGKNAIAYIKNKSLILAYDTDEIYLNEDASYMFSDMYSEDFQTFDIIQNIIMINNIKSNNTTNFSYMFDGCGASKIDANLSLEKSLDASYMFRNSKALYIGYISNIKPMTILNGFFNGATIDTNRKSNVFKDPFNIPTGII